MKKELQQSTEQKNQDKEQLNGNAYRNVENTPFTIVTVKEDIMIVIGQDVVKKGFNTLDEAEEYIHEKPWELMLNAGVIYYEYLKEAKMLNQKEKTK